MNKKANILAYTAGIIDGEGCISIHKSMNRNSYRRAIHISVGNTNPWLINWLEFNFGGSSRIYHPKNSKWKDSWQWELSAKQAGEFLEMILPYLKLKRAQAELAIQFQKAKHHPRGKPQDKKEIALEEAQKILMGKMNKRGKDAKE